MGDHSYRLASSFKHREGVMIYILIIPLAIAGAGLLWLSAGPWAVLGVFLLMWGNNISLAVAREEL